MHPSSATAREAAVSDYPGQVRSGPGWRSGQVMPLITRCIVTLGLASQLGLSRPFSWRLCSEKNVVINVASEMDATKVLEMVEAGWNRRTRGPARVA